ncbi:ABC transporter substrate-binding protein [Thiohalocapsa marina]|uniref:ABC transporter substrate-binding protein n=1 Tax=Thiohalocapsa marina TaxID=424902 RepID=UPI001FEB88E8|nr:ABC transporter substrate-binding protein [Thiohalocapsa marina]
MRRRGFLAASLALPWLGGCAPAPARRRDDVLRFGLAGPVRNLDPRLATDATSARVNRLLYVPLVDFDAASRPVPVLATWEQRDATRYRFTLGHGGRRFADGQRLTAADVAATYRSVLDPATASPHRATLSLIDAVEVLDADRLEFRLQAPDPLFPAYLGVGILPAGLIESGQGFQRVPVGSGTFRLLDWPEPGRLLLERRRDRQRFELVTVKDPNVRVMKLLRGEIDLLQNDLAPELVAFLRRRRGIRMERIDGVNFSYLGFNLEDPATGDPRVRRAVAHGIDREAVLRYLFRGGGRTAEAMFPPEHWAGAPELRGHLYDPAASRALLADAGWSGERRLVLSYKTSSDPFRLRLATVIQSQLAAVGIDLRIQSYDWGTFFGDIKAGRFQLYGLTWVGIRTPDIFRYVFHSAALPPAGANRGRYRSAVVDALIEQAQQAPDPARRAALYRQLQARLHADLPYVPLWYEDQFYAARDDIVGYHLAADGNYDGLDQVHVHGAEPSPSSRLIQ